MKPKNPEHPPTTRSGKTPVGVPQSTLIVPLPLNRDTTVTGRPGRLWKSLFVLGILAGLIGGAGFLFIHLSRWSPAGNIHTAAPVAAKTETPRVVDAAEGKQVPLPPKFQIKPTPAAASRSLTQESAVEESRSALVAQEKAATGTGEKGISSERGEKNETQAESLEERFHRHLSGGLTAYHEKNYDLALSELSKARELKPDAREAHEALAQVEAVVRLQRIGDLQVKAVQAENQEGWTRAAELYAAALALDGALQFAGQGRERTLERMRLDKRLQFYLEKPEALESDEALVRAEEVLARAEAIEPKDPRLSRQLEAFRHLVEQTQIQIRVTLVSDNLTEVSVYRVGGLGRFMTQELLLRPGRYTVVGSRQGYKDVRLEILVKPGEILLSVAIACREKV